MAKSVLPKDNSIDKSASPVEVKHILYVDDDEGMLFLVRRMLMRSGYGVTTFETAEDALVVLKRDPKQFDLILTDFNMPKMNGLDFAVQVRQLQPSMVIVLISGYITDDIVQKAKEVGVDRLLYKPNTVEELGQSIQELLE